MSLRAIRPTIIGFCFLVCGSTHASDETGAEPARFESAIDLFEDGEFEKSRIILKTLLRSRPGSGLYWYNLGNACLMLGRWQEAASAYSQVDRIGGPLAEPANLYRARVYQLMGKDEAARESLSRMSWSLVVEGAAGVFPDPGYTLAIHGDWELLFDEMISIRPGMGISWFEGVENGSSSQLTVLGSVGADWERGKWLVSVAPYASYRIVDFRPAFLLPGARVGVEYGDRRDRFGAEYLQEGTTVLASEFEPWREQLKQLRTYWSALGGTPEWRVGLKGRSRTVVSSDAADAADAVITIGPDASADVRIGRKLGVALNASLGFGQVPEFEGGTRLSWRSRSDLTFHTEIFGSASRLASQVIAAGGVSWAAL